MTPNEVKGFIKSIGSAVNVVYGTTTICMHNGKLVQVSPQGEWIVIKHITCKGKQDFKAEFLGFFLTKKPANTPVKTWHHLIDMHRTPTFSPKFVGPNRQGDIGFGDFFGVLYTDEKGVTNCNNGRFLYAIGKNGQVLSRISKKDVNQIMWVYYTHWNWSPKAPFAPKSKTCLLPGTAYRNYWIPEMTRKGPTILDLIKG